MYKFGFHLILDCSSQCRRWFFLWQLLPWLLVLWQPCIRISELRKKWSCQQVKHQFAMWSTLSLRNQWTLFKRKPWQQFLVLQGKFRQTSSSSSSSSSSYLCDQNTSGKFKFFHFQHCFSFQASSHLEIGFPLA